MPDPRRISMFAGTALALLFAEPGWAQADGVAANNDYVPCSDATATVVEVTPELGYNDFNGVGQHVYALGLSRASCLKSGDPTRWHLELNASHIDQRGYKAEAAVAGAGFSLHPFKRRPDFTVFPIARVGHENIHSGPNNFVYGGGLTVVDSIALDSRREVASTGPLLVLAARADYTNRRSSDRLVNLANPRSGRTDLYGSAALDAAIGRSPWRARAWVGYQRLDSDYLNGYATIGLSARPQRVGELTYGWNFSVSGNFGDHDYRGAILTVTKRFLQRRN